MNTNQNDLTYNEEKKKLRYSAQSDKLTEVNQNLTCYESLLDCCGSFFGCWRAWCPCICFCFSLPYTTVHQGQQGLLQKFGKFQKILNPGYHQINVCSDRVITVSMKTFCLVLEKQQISTNDNITLEIDAIVYYRLVDIVKSTYRVEKILDSLKDMTYSVLRSVCGENTLQQLLVERNRIGEDIEQQLFDMVNEWGVYIESVFIKDMLISKEFQQYLSMGPKAIRIGQSKVISAKSDVESAKLLRQAADLLETGSAMQIRYLETMKEIAKDQSKKVKFKYNQNLIGFIPSSQFISKLE